MDPRPWPELQSIIPPLSTDERKQLADSIAASGVLVPIIVLPDGRIIDGHHRWELSGGNAPSAIVDVSESEGLILGITLNLARRHMSPEQVAEVHKVLRKERELRREVALKLREGGKTQEEVAAVVGVDQRTIGRWEEKGSNRQEPNPSIDLRVSIPKKDYRAIHNRVEGGEDRSQVAADYKVTPRRIGQIVSLVEAQDKVPRPVDIDVPVPDKKYKCIVIDPPWPVKKIQREERPLQGPHLDYPTMTLEQIGELPVGELAEESGCHIYLWVTQKYLPEGLQLFDKWNVKYQCVMTWVKPTGITPFSWMYNTEHVLFGRVGSLNLEQLGLKLSFLAPVTRHSAKPDAFYDRVVKASPEPRLEMFARRQRGGFDVWGNEVAGLEKV